MTISHTFVSTISDSTDATLVRPSNWNADHEIIVAASLKSSAGATGDVVLVREAAGALGLRSTSSSTVATAFSAYNTYSDGSNYERAVFDWTTNANALSVGTQASGTGSLRLMYLLGARFEFGINGFAQQANITGGPGFSQLNIDGVALDYQHGDVALYRNSAGVVEVNSGSAGVYRDVKLRNLTITATATSTASSGFITLKITSLPTTDPGVTGQLWQSGGTVKIST